MNLHLNFVSHFHHTFKENIRSSFTSQQKKILAIALTVITCFAACLYYYMRCRPEIQTIDHKVNKNPPPDQKKDQMKSDEQNEDVESPIIPTNPFLSINDELQGKLLAKSLLFRTTKPAHWKTDAASLDLNSYQLSDRLAQNAQARMKIIEALGGEKACKRIPIVECPEESDYFDCFIDYSHFPKGHAIVQGEDQAGRKFVLLRLEDKTDKTIFIHRIFQRRVETDITPLKREPDGSLKNTNGSSWVAVRFPQFIWEADKIADMIKHVLNGNHKSYILAPQD